MLHEQTTPKFSRPFHVLPLSSRNRKTNVRFTDRYFFDGPASNTEQEHSRLGNAIRSLAEGHQTGIVVVDGIEIYSAWRPDKFDEAGVRYVLDRALNDRWTLSLPDIGFRPAKFRYQTSLEKQRTEQHRQYLTNAWLETEHGLFWTWEKINLNDLQGLFVKSIEWMNKSIEERREMSLGHLGRPTLASQFGDIRDQLLASSRSKG